MREAASAADEVDQRLSGSEDDSEALIDADEREGEEGRFDDDEPQADLAKEPQAGSSADAMPAHVHAARAIEAALQERGAPAAATSRRMSLRNR